MNTQFATPILEPVQIGAVETAPVPVSDRWLDELADGLAGNGWMSQDVTARIGQDLLAALRNEIQTLDSADALRKAGVGPGSKPTRDRAVRRDRIAWLQGVTTVQADLFGFFELVRLGLNQRLFLGLKRFEAHYATYHEGDFYRRHVDSFQGRATRVVSLVLYLNDDWQQADGGALQVYNQEDEICGTVLPEAGRMALFLSEEIPHEVLPANRTRYSIACWFRCDEVPIPL